MMGEVAFSFKMMAESDHFILKFGVCVYEIKTLMEIIFIITYIILEQMAVFKVKTVLGLVNQFSGTVKNFL